jgi:hypothetical protein
MNPHSQISGDQQGIAQARPQVAPAPRSEIAEAHSDLHDVISSLEDRVDNLAAQLGSILRPPSPSDEAAKAVDRPGSDVELADSVHVQVSRLRTLHARLNDLSHRIAL